MMESLSEHIINSFTSMIHESSEDNKLAAQVISKFNGSYSKIKNHLDQKLVKSLSTQKELKSAIKHVEKLKRTNQLKRVRSEAERKAMFASMRARKF